MVSSTCATDIASVDAPIVIIGGGPCGLGAAIRLTELGESNWIMVEAEGVFGGLSASFTDNKGFTWDRGPHIVFSHYDYYDQVVNSLGPECIENGREAKIYLDAKTEVDYPLQDHVVQLPQKYHFDCLWGLLQAHMSSNAQARPSTPSVQESPDELDLGTDPSEALHLVESEKLWQQSAARSQRTFAKWASDVLGDGILDVFMRPYNEKIWGYPLEEMGCLWLGERVSAPNFESVLRNFTAPPGTGRVRWGPNATFRYPKHGGTGAVWQSIGTSLPNHRVKLSTTIKKIDEKSKILMLSDGTELAYSHLISTVSIKTLVHDLLSHPSKSLKDSASALKHSTTHIIGLGVKGTFTRDWQWAYFPSATVPFYRCAVLSNFSKYMCPLPDEQYSLLFEISSTPWKTATGDAASMITRVESAAREYGLISPSDEVISSIHREIPFGYPTPSIDRDRYLGRIMPQLARINIHSRGRFGAWKYEAANQDHCFMQGVEVVDSIFKDSACSKISSEFSEEPTVLAEPAGRPRSVVGFSGITKM